MNISDKSINVLDDALWQTPDVNRLKTGFN